MHSNKKTYKKYYIAFLTKTKNYIKIDELSFISLSTACSHLEEVKDMLKEGTLYKTLSKDEQTDLIKTLCVCEQTFVEKIMWSKLKPVIISKKVLN